MSQPEMTLPELLEQYVFYNRRLRAPKTVYVYKGVIRSFAEMLGKEAATLSDLTDDNLIRFEKWFEAKGRSFFTVNERTGRIKSLWTWAAKKRLVDLFPTVQRVPTPDPVRRAWSQAELKKLFAATVYMPGTYGNVQANAWWNAFILLTYETGERTGAMLKLRWEWLDERGLDVPGVARKTGKKAFYSISPACRKAIERLRLSGSELIFPWPLSNHSFYNHYKRLLKIAGLPHTGKDLNQRMRRTHLTWWRIGGMDATKRAQHSNSSLTDRFYIDQSLMPQVNPADVLPDISLSQPSGEDEGDEK